MKIKKAGDFNAFIIKASTGKTHSQIARNAKVCTASVARIISEDAGVSLKVMIKLAESLGYDVVLQKKG